MHEARYVSQNWLCTCEVCKAVSSNICMVITEHNIIMHSSPLRTRTASTSSYMYLLPD